MYQYLHRKHSPYTACVVGTGQDRKVNSCCLRKHSDPSSGSWYHKPGFVRLGDIYSFSQFSMIMCPLYLHSSHFSLTKVGTSTICCTPLLYWAVICWLYTPDIWKPATFFFLFLWLCIFCSFLIWLDFDYNTQFSVCINIVCYYIVLLKITDKNDFSNNCNISCNSVKSWLNYIEQHLSLVSAEGLIHVSLLQLYVLRWRWRLGSWVLWRDNCDKKWTEKSQAEEDSKKLNTSGEEIINPTKWR